jgi:hypothetical protein
MSGNRIIFCRNPPGTVMDLFDFEKIEYYALLQKGLVVLLSIAFFWNLVRYMWSFLNIEKDPVRELVTGAAGMLNPLFFWFIFILFDFFVSLSLLGKYKI